MHPTPIHGKNNKKAGKDLRSQMILILFSISCHPWKGEDQSRQDLHVFMPESEKDSQGSQSHDSQAGVVYYYFG